MKAPTPLPCLLLFCAVFLLSVSLAGAANPLPIEKLKDLQVLLGPTNGVLLERHGHRLAIYGDPPKTPRKSTRYFSRIIGATLCGPDDR